jgi:predicted Zn-dependent protease
MIPADRAEAELGEHDRPALVIVTRRRALRMGGAGAIRDDDTFVQVSHPDADHLPEGGTPRAHKGFDLGTAALRESDGQAALDAAAEVCAAAGARLTAAWVAEDVELRLAASNGTRLSDRLTSARLFVVAQSADGATARATGASVAAADVDGAAVARRALMRLPSASAPSPIVAGATRVVLDADAVAGILDHLGEVAFSGSAHTAGHGPLAGRLGTRVAASAINLSDSPRFARTLPRAFDAEGTLKAPLPLIQDGVAHRVVHDRASAALAETQSTGNATGAGGPRPTNIVLIGGGAADVHELAAPIEDGLYVTGFQAPDLLVGMRVIRGGTITADPALDARLAGDALEALTHTEALESVQRLVPLGPDEELPISYGVVCPSLRTVLTLAG